MNLVLIKVTPSSKGGYINTWECNSTSVKTPLGEISTGKAHYCTKSINVLPIGTQATINMADWRVQESDPFTGSDGEQHTTKWLRVK